MFCAAAATSLISFYVCRSAVSMVLTAAIAGASASTSVDADPFGSVVLVLDDAEPGDPSSQTAPMYM